MQGLHNMGATMMGVMGMPPVGCMPVEAIGTLINPLCSEKPNNDAEEYNNKLKAVIEELKQTLPELKIVYVDIFTPLKHIIDHPHRFGTELTTYTYTVTQIHDINLLSIVAYEMKKMQGWK